MATYYFLVEVKLDKVPDDYEEDVIQSIQDTLDEDANPGQVFYENSRGDEITKDIKDWTVTRHYPTEQETN